MNQKYEAEKAKDEVTGEATIKETDDIVDTEALSKATSSLPYNKQKNAQKLADILTSKDYLAWDQSGNMIAPNIPGMQKMDLLKLMKLILYKDAGTQKQINMVSKMLKPYVNELVQENLVINPKNFQSPYFKGYHRSKKLTKYMPW